MCFHRCFYDRQSDSASTVFSCSCFIDFIEFYPQFINIFLWNMVSRIKYFDPHVISMTTIADFDDPTICYVIPGIAQIVVHNFFDHKFICPHMSLWLIKYDLDFLLFHKDLA